MGLSPTGKSASIAAQALSSSASCRFIPAHCNPVYNSMFRVCRLERAYEDRSYYLPPYLLTDARMDSLRSDSRFGELRRRVGLPERRKLSAAHVSRGAGSISLVARCTIVSRLFPKISVVASQ